MIGYEIISTGSKGNAVVIGGRVLIDCGVPFQALKGACKGLQLVLLTHVHQDHFNRRTIKRLAKERPSLRFGCCEWLVGELAELVELRNIDLYEPGREARYGAELAVTPFLLAHNVPNCGHLVRMCGKTVFYATDTNSLEGIEAKGCDLYMIEANYGEAEIVERIRRKQEAGEYCHEWDVLKNHLSKEKADDFLYRNMGPNSRYVYLHGHEEKEMAVNA